MKLLQIFKVLLACFILSGLIAFLVIGMSKSVAQPSDLFTNQSPIDPSLFTNSTSSTETDFVTRQSAIDILRLIPPVIENTIDCPMILLLCEGTDNNDEFRGTYRIEIIEGRGGDDFVRAGDESDSVFGDEGNDLLFGEGGKDNMNGHNGNDRMYGGPGSDYIVARCIINRTETPDYKDFVGCGEGYDRVWVDPLDVYENCEIVNGYDITALIFRSNFTNLTRNP